MERARQTGDDVSRRLNPNACAFPEHPKLPEDNKLGDHLRAIAKMPDSQAPIYDRPPRDAPSPDATDRGGVHIAELDQRPNPIGSPIAQSAPQAKCLKSGA